MAKHGPDDNEHRCSLRSTTAPESLSPALDIRGGRRVPVVTPAALCVHIVDTFLAVRAAIGQICTAVLVQAGLIGVLSQLAHISAVAAGSCHRGGNYATRDAKTTPSAGC